MDRRTWLRGAIAGFGIFSAISGALVLGSSWSNGQEEKPPLGLQEEFVDNLKDYNKTMDRVLDTVAKIPPVKEASAMAKLAEKFQEYQEDAVREVKGLSDAAKTADEKEVTKCVRWSALCALLCVNTSMRAQFESNHRWAAYYSAQTQTLATALKESARKKKWAGIKCQVCSGALIVSCPACEGKGKCAAQVASGEKCEGGVFKAGFTGINRLCPVCQGTAICLFCEGVGKIPCGIERRSIESKIETLKVLGVASGATEAGQRPKAEGKTRDLINNLENACRLYERDYNAYPPGDPKPPFGTKKMVEVLSKRSPKELPYMEFSKDDFNESGDLIDPCNPKDIIHYRNNTVIPPSEGGPPVHNRYSVDLWTSDTIGTPTGINNWRLER